MSPDMQIEFPHLTTDVDRHKRPRLYARIKNGLRIRLRQKPGTQQFIDEYQTAVETLQAAPVATPGERDKEGTLGWLEHLYTTSENFKALDAQSQITRRAVLKTCLEEPLKPGSPLKMRHVPLVHFGAHHLRIIRDRKAAFRAAANTRLKYMSSMLGWAVEDNKMTFNPCRDVKRLQRASAGFHTWTVEEIEQYLATHGPGTMARMALYLLLFLGPRKSDGVKMGRTNLRRKILPDGAVQHFMSFKVKKTEKVKADSLELPMPPVLVGEIETYAKDRLIFLQTSFGKPFTAKGFGNWMRDRCDEAGLFHCTAHGLRKAGATIAAENGASDRQLMAFYGWTSASQATAYTKKANQKKMAAENSKLIAWDDTGT